MTVSELIEHLSEHNPDMDVYVTTKNEPCNEVVSFDYENCSCYGRYRGVYLEIRESE